LAASRWRQCALVDGARTRHRNYVRLLTRDEAGVIGKIGTAFGVAGVSIQSIVQYEASGTTSSSGAEIVVITHEVEESRFRQALATITALPEVQTVAACLRTL
jgi:homoserine dehydrogenase